MKPKTNRLRHLVPFTVLLLTAISVAVSGCKNKKSEETPVQPLSPTEYSLGDTATAVNLLGGTPIPFYTLKLEVASLQTLFADEKVIKIVVQSIDENTEESEAMSLVAYGVNKKGEKITGPVGFTPLLDINPTVFPGLPIITGDQDLTIKQVKEVLELEKKKGKIDPALFRPLQFTPGRLNVSRHLFYLVTEYASAENDGSATTNPSPPKPPCEADCDYN